MGATQSRKVVVINKNGQRQEFNDDDSINVETTVTSVCDNPTCAKLHNKEAPASVSFVLEKVQTDPNEVPDEQYAGISRAGFQQETKWYCSRLCEKEAVRDWVAPLSPRQQNQLDRACEKVKEKP
jgi:hypothetical protein